MRHPDEGTGREPGGAGAGGAHVDEGTIHAWLDGALDAAESARVERHVAACAACASRVAEARGLVAAASRILTRLDDVPAGVAPAGAAEGARPVVAPSPARSDARVVRERRRWKPAAWLSTAAAAAIVTVLVVRQGVDREALTETAAPLDRLDTAKMEAPAAPTPGAGIQSAPTASRAEADAPATAPSPRPARPPAGVRTGDAGAETLRSVVVTGDSALAAGAGSSLQGRVAGAQVAAAEERAVGNRVVQIPPPPAAADLAGAAREGMVRQEAASKSALRDAAADSVAVAQSFLELPAPTDAAASGEMGFRLEPASDSATRAAIARRPGIGSRILRGARLVSSAVDTTARPLERRSIYALEDGAIVTLVERASAVALEAVVTTSVDDAERARTARRVRPRTEPEPAAAAPTPAPAPATPPPEVGQETRLADGSRVLRPSARETIVVRPDGLVRLEWREIGAELSLEGRVSIDRVRELKGRVGL
jgi:hypothetical protein